MNRTTNRSSMGTRDRVKPFSYEIDFQWADRSATDTGGMGCYGPAPLGTPQLIHEVDRTILEPTIHGMCMEREFSIASC